MKKMIPSNGKAWVTEILKAYSDAEEAIAFGPAAGVHIKEDDLFHMAPIICLKFRGLHNNKKNLKMATDAALSSYVATKELQDGITNNPYISFAFCYIASHFGLGLIQENEANEVIQYMVDHQNQLKNGYQNKNT